MDTIVVGKIVRPQGLKGEVKVRPLINDPDWLENLKYVFLGDSQTKTKVLAVSVRLGWAYICLEGVNSIEEAEKLRNQELSVLRADGYKPKKDEYFIDDLIGLRLIDEGGAELGRVIDVQNYGASDIISALYNYGEVMFPFLEHIVLDVDLLNKTMTVNKKAFLETVNPEEI